MDILDELNKTIKEKKEDWNYTPKREKSETDKLVGLLEKSPSEAAIRAAKRFLEKNADTH